MVNNWSISMLPAIWLPFCVLAIFSSKKRQQGIDSHTSATAIEFHLGWISETTHFFYFEGLCLYLKNNTHYCTGVFFHWDHSFIHHYHLWEGKHSSAPAKFAYLHTHNKKCSCCLTGCDRREKWSFIPGAQVSCTSISYEID